MAKTYETPPGVDIAALRTKKGTGAVDLMMPGNGTPWEDRGAQGAVKAFMQTCVKSITSPALLLDHIRRPDTTAEARQFAIACSVFWAIAVAVHMILWHLTYPVSWIARWQQENEGSYATQYGVKTAIMSLVAGAGAFVLLVMFASRMYYALVASELKNAAPRVLLYNMFCYCMGPSILAPIPVIGPPLAIILILVAWCMGGGKRLYISWRGAIVAGMLTMTAVLVIAGAAWFVLNFLLNQMTGLVEPEKVDESQKGSMRVLPTR
jgi:hypothetical protein